MKEIYIYSHVLLFRYLVSKKGLWRHLVSETVKFPTSNEVVEVLLSICTLLNFYIIKV